jgi:hypothetical protein
MKIQVDLQRLAPALVLMALLFPTRVRANVAGVETQTPCNLLDYGAVGDGATMNTRAIQAMIDACHARGGGTVLVPPGRFVTGTLHLRNNITLELCPGAALLGSTNINDYTTNTFRMLYDDGTPALDRCLLFARNATNIAVIGHGEIDGRGSRVFFPNRGDPKASRPLLLRLLECRNLTLRDVTLRDPASWTTAWLYCEDIVVDGVRIDSRVNGNGDGLDFDGCRNVRVSNCSFDTSDDSICLQTSRADRPCADIAIANCIFVSEWAGIRIGLLSSGDFENITVSNCVFRDIKDSGLKIQTCEGGSMRNMVFSNLIMKKVPRPIFMTFNRQRTGVDTPTNVPPMKRMGDFLFANVRVDNSELDEHSVLVITGLPGHPIENITLDNFNCTVGGGGTREQAARRELEELTADNQRVHRWPEYEKLHGAALGHALYARHVRGLTVRNSQFAAARPDYRPSVVCDDVEQVVLAGLQMRGFDQMEAVVRLQDVRGAVIRGCLASGSPGSYVRVEGGNSSQIWLADDNLSAARRSVSLAPEVAGDAIVSRTKPK